MRLLYLFFASHMFLTVLSGQMHDNYWIFGYDYDSPGNNNGTLLHFENGYPEFNIQNIKYDMGLYSIVCSDSTGNLIFHTNGRQIRNRQNNIMQGGDTINPGQVWVDYPDDYPTITSGLAIPAPGLPNHYYLIHTSNGYEPNILSPFLYYSLIDMNANAGLGKVIAKNKVIASGDLPNPVAIKHGNGRDWWLIVGNYVSKTYMIFLIDPTGCHLVNEESIAPGSFTNYGYCKASPDGTIFVNNESDTGLWIFDFDRCQGFLSHPRVLPYQPPVFWTSTNAFSPDGRFLYIGTHLVIYQLDMQTIDSTYLKLDTIALYEYGASPNPPYYTQFLLPELAADEKIYYTTFNNSTAFHVINRPDFPLLAADIAQRGLLLPEHNGQTRCYFPNYRLGKWAGSPCDSLGLIQQPDSKFRDVSWSEYQKISSNEEIEVLKLPLHMNIPVTEEPSHEQGYNPLDMKILMKKAHARKQ